MSDLLKLIAFDHDDLNIISAHVQDAVTQLANISYSAAEQRLILQMNRFVWEARSARRWFFKPYQRRLCALHFNRVQALKTKGLDQQNKEQVLSLLAIHFTPSKSGAVDGKLELVFSANIIIAAEVECLECQLSDLGATWSASSKPRH